MEGRHQENLFKNKAVLTFTVILFALAAGVYVRNQRKPAELSTEELLPLDLPVDELKVTDLIIAKGANNEKADKVELKKEESGWRVVTFSNAHADEGKIQNFLKAV